MIESSQIKRWIVVNDLPKVYNLRKVLNLIMAIIFSNVLLMSCSAKDESPVPTTVVVTPEIAGLKPGQSLQLSASVVDQFDEELDLPIIWKSENDSVATITASGLVTAHSVGSTCILAIYEDIVGVMELTVSENRRRILSELFTSST